jgi:hypothetical protein
MLGPSITKALEAKADHTIRTLQYNGQTKGLSFDRFVTNFTQAFLDCGLDYPEDKKVSLLLRAITDPSLQIACGQIRCSRDLKVDFTAAVSYIVEELASRADSHSRGSRNVSTVDRRGGRGGRNSGRGRGGRGTSGRGNRSGRGSGRGNNRSSTPATSEGLTKWDPNQPGAYYTKKAYARMTPEQRTKNYEAKRQAGTGQRQNSQIATLTSLTQRVQELTNNLEVAQAVNQHQSQSIGATISGKRKRRDEE